MKVLHVIAGPRVGHVVTDEPCPCTPYETATARPGEQPTVTLTHRPLPRKAH